MIMLEHLLTEKDLQTFGEEYKRVRRKLLLNPQDKAVQREAQKLARVFRKAQKELARTLAKLSALPRNVSLSPRARVDHSILLENTAEYCELLQIPLSTLLEALGVNP
jgi:hypothetical protein